MEGLPPITYFCSYHDLQARLQVHNTDLCDSVLYSKAYTHRGTAVAHDWEGLTGCVRLGGLQARAQCLVLSPAVLLSICLQTYNGCPRSAFASTLLPHYHGSIQHDFGHNTVKSRILNYFFKITMADIRN